MKKKIFYILGILALVSITSISFVMANAAIPQKSVLTGTVTKTVAKDDVVKSGTPLVEVSTLTGTTAAARATVDGKITNVLVNVGDNVSPGQIVVYIEE